MNAYAGLALRYLYGDEFIDSSRYCRGIRRRKKITERSSILYSIAQLSVETGIPPREFIDMDSEMYAAIIQVLTDRAKEIRNASRGRRR
jgi:hypothetical protein